MRVTKAMEDAAYDELDTDVMPEREQRAGALGRERRRFGARALVAELEAQLATISDAHARYQRNDLSQEEFEGTIAEIAEGNS